MAQNTEIGQKTFWQYWWFIIQNAFRKAWDKLGALGTFLGIVVSVVVAYLAERPKSLSGFGGDEALMAAEIFLILFIIVIIFYICREPVVIYNEKISTLHDRDELITELQEATKPKLEIYYDESDGNSYQLWDGGKTYVYRVKVKNAGNKQIRDIKTDIIEMKPASYGNLPVKLHFMNDVDNFLNPKGTVLVDVIEAHAARENFAGDMFFYAERPDKRFPCTLQGHEILISVSGHESPSIEKRFKFTINDSNSKHPFTFKEID